MADLERRLSRLEKSAVERDDSPETGMVWLCHSEDEYQQLRPGKTICRGPIILFTGLPEQMAPIII
jgi:hypothetical protein